jgi:hypothetical protein
VRVASKGQITLEVTSGTNTVKVTIYTRELRTWRQSESNLYQPDSNCVIDRVPCSIVETIKIVKNGKPVFVWRSVYADLGDLNDATLIIGKEISTLELSVGDGAEGYFVKIEFDGKSVRRRTIHLDTDEPSDQTEQTVYHMVED